MQSVCVRALAIAAGLLLAACAGVAPRAAAPGQGSAPGASSAPGAAVSPAGSGPPRASQSSALNQRLLSLPPADEATDLPLGAGDLVEVSVFDVAELSNLKLRIPNSGDIVLPLLGAVPAAGQTALELQHGIRDRLRTRYMHDPQVSVFVHEHRSQRVSVIGAVRQAGVFTVTTRLRLADALAMAGGLSEEAGSSVYVTRRVPAQLVSASQSDSVATEQVMTVVDLESLVSGKQELNLPLAAGDVIDVPRAGSYYVGGEVNRPGAFLLKARTSVDQAPMAAGGVTDDADWDDVRLYRTRPDGTKDVRRLSLNDFEAGTPGPELQANDVVVVGKSPVKAFLYGVRDFFRFGVGMSLR